MNIAFLTPEFPHVKTGPSGGLGTSIFNLAKGLIQSGHEVSVLVYGQNEDEVFKDNGVTFYKIKNIKLKGFSRFLTQNKIQRLINNLVKNNKIDILEAPDWTGITSNIHSTCPIIIRLHGSDTYFCYLEDRPVKFLNRYYEKKALQKADGLLSVSRYTADLTKKLFSLHKEFMIIPNGIDLEGFSDHEIENEENTILYFGTLIRKKGALELPLIFNEVCKNNKNVKLILIGRDASDILSGNTSTWKMMQELFDTRAIQNVIYLGSVPYNEIKNSIAKASVCVFPTFAEALPLSWIEAMTMNKAIVASNIGWANEVIEDSVSGFLVHPLSHKEYAQKIQELLQNEKLRFQFGAQARKKVEEEFCIEIVAKKNVEFYEEIIFRCKND
jgi:starch synthase